MNANSMLASVKSQTDRQEPLFAPGALLQADDLTAISEYFKKRERLFFRTLLGCGVMCGLVVTATEACSKLTIGVACGVALGCDGDQVEVPTAQDIEIDLCVTPPVEFPLWVALRRTEKCCAPRTAVCVEDDEESPSVCTRLREEFEIAVFKDLPPCSCGCHLSKQEMEFPEKLPPEDFSLECKCADPDEHGCHGGHYDGDCCCDCAEGCDCEWIVLARVQKKSDNPKETEWLVDHRYRRFVRPVLMRDPQVEKEQPERETATIALRREIVQNTKPAPKS